MSMPANMSEIPGDVTVTMPQPRDVFHNSAQLYLNLFLKEYGRMRITFKHMDR